MCGKSHPHRDSISRTFQPVDSWATVSFAQIFPVEVTSHLRQYCIAVGSFRGPGYLGRNKDSLRAGRSGDRIPVGARYSAPVQTDPETHPASYAMGTGSFPGVERSGRGVNQPHTSSAEVKERVKTIPLLPLWAFVACSRVKFTFTFIGSFFNFFIDVYFDSNKEDLEKIFAKFGPKNFFREIRARKFFREIRTMQSPTNRSWQTGRHKEANRRFLLLCESRLQNVSDTLPSHITWIIAEPTAALSLWLHLLNALNMQLLHVMYQVKLKQSRYRTGVTQGVPGS